MILPAPTILEHEHLRVIAYYRLQAGIKITLHTDISTDLDFMLLDIRCEGSRHPPTCLINLYNQTELGESQDPCFTTDRLARINFHPGTATVIMGDWNLHHNLWNSMIDMTSTTVRIQDVVDWLEGQGFSLCSEKDVIMRSRSGSQQDSIINLTFANESAFRQGLVQNHR